LASQRFVLLRSGDDLGVEMCELLGKFEALIRKGIRSSRVVEIEDAEYATFEDQRHRDGRFDIEAFADDLERLAVGLPAEPQGPTICRNATRDAMTERNPYFGPQFRFDTRRNPHAKLAGGVIQQHEGAALCASDGNGNLEHARKEFVSVDGEVEGFHDLVERFQQI
jgi:hypothetical protein